MKRTLIGATLFASSAAAIAAPLASPQEQYNPEASTALRLLEERTADGKPVAAFDLPLVVRDEQGNVVLDAREQGPLPLARLASAPPETLFGPGQAAGPLDDASAAQQPT